MAWICASSVATHANASIHAASLCLDHCILSNLPREDWLVLLGVYDPVRWCCIPGIAPQQDLPFHPGSTRSLSDLWRLLRALLPEGVPSQEMACLYSGNMVAICCTVPAASPSSTLPRIYIMYFACIASHPTQHHPRRTTWLLLEVGGEWESTPQAYASRLLVPSFP